MRKTKIRSTAPILRLALVAAATVLAGCASSGPPGEVPPPGPPGTYVALTVPFVAVGDSQEHEATGFPMQDNDGAVDAYVEVAQRAPELPLFGRRVLESVLLRHGTEPIIHLGDLLDMSCQSEAQRMTRVFEAVQGPGAILPGNHDGLMFGIFNYNVASAAGDEGATKWNRGCRCGAREDSEAGRAGAPSGPFTKGEFIGTYLTGVASVPWPHPDLVLPHGPGDRKVSWRNGGPDPFIEAIEAVVYAGKNYALSYMAQKLRPPRAPGAPRGVTIIAIDTNQVDVSVSRLDTLRGLSPGDIGHVREDQLAAISGWMDEAQRAGDLVVFAGHHNWGRLSDSSKRKLRALWERLDHPLVYLSAHTHRGFWAVHRSTGRGLLELNVSSLSDWPIAYRRVSFEWDEAVRRIKVVAELMPHGSAPVESDADLLREWEQLTCAASGIPTETLRSEDLEMVKGQKASRGSLYEWLLETAGPWCDSCLQKLYAHGNSYQDHMLKAIRQTQADLGKEALELYTLKLPAFCGSEGLSGCTALLLEEEAEGLKPTAALFRKKAQLVDVASNRLDAIKTPHARAYMACRAVLAAKIDFDATPEKRTPGGSEASRREMGFFRAEATIGME